MPRFHYPQLSGQDLGLFRSPGAGFGNLLFPISRALVSSTERENDIFVYPTIPQLKIGPWLRFENDKRMYCFVMRGRSVQEWSIFWRAKRSRRRITEKRKSYEINLMTDETIIYEGLGNFFHDFERSKRLIYSWLVDNMIQYKRSVEPAELVVHVRLGDFSEYDSRKVETCYRTPFDWYRRAIAHAREKLDNRESILLLTDGDHRKVSQSIGLVNYRVPPPQLNALQTIMLGSNAKTLIASKSTFSMWMRFLGDSKIIWESGFDLANFFSISNRDIILS